MPAGSRRRRASGVARIPCSRPASLRSRAFCRARRRSGQIKDSIRRTYGSKGEQCRAAELPGRRREPWRDCTRSRFPLAPPAGSSARRPCPRARREFVRQVTARMFEGLGDEIPVSLMPVDGTFPSGTAAWEKRNIAEEVPVWRPELCIQCGQCSFVCPHSVIRAKYYDAARLTGAPQELQVDAGQRARLSGRALQPAVLRGGLHRLRSLHRGLPGPQRRRSGSQGDQSAEESPIARGRARQYRVLRSACRTTIARA